MRNASWDKAERRLGYARPPEPVPQEVGHHFRRTPATNAWSPPRVRRCGCGVSRGGTLGAKPSYQIISPRFAQCPLDLLPPPSGLQSSRYRKFILPCTSAGVFLYQLFICTVIPEIPEMLELPQGAQAVGCPNIETPTVARVHHMNATYPVISRICFSHVARE
jgi:hypothetical protein